MANKSVTNFKRNYDTMVSCKKCKKLSMVSDKCYSYVCHHCNTYNNVKEANERFKAGDYGEVIGNSSLIGFPNVRPEGDGARDYMNLRDEYEIRADMFKNGQTRDSMGVDKFSNELKKKLVKNKCYRGFDKTGV
jgi:hypothetical protein